MELLPISLVSKPLREKSIQIPHSVATTASVGLRRLTQCGYKPPAKYVRIAKQLATTKAIPWLLVRQINIFLTAFLRDGALVPESQEWIRFQLCGGHAAEIWSRHHILTVEREALHNRIKARIEKGNRIDAANG